MNDHTRRILTRMRDLLEAHSADKMELRELVDSLEWSLNAVEERLPSDFYSAWYDAWGTLEQVLALGTEVNRAGEISHAITALAAALGEQIEASRDC